MNKFLKLIEQSLPDEDKQLQYTVLEKIANVFSKALKGSQGIVVNAEYPDKLIFGIDRDKVVFTLTDIIDGDSDGKVDTEEDGEEYSIDKAVDRLASKSKVGSLFGYNKTRAGRAATAQKEREAVDAEAIDAYRLDTVALKQAIQNAKANRNKQFNVI